MPSFSSKTLSIGRKKGAEAEEKEDGGVDRDTGSKDASESPELASAAAGETAEEKRSADMSTGVGPDWETKDVCVDHLSSLPAEAL